MASRAQMKNALAHIALMEEGARESLKSGGEIDKLVQKHFYYQLYNSKNEDGTPRPQSAPAGKKKPATIKAYKKHGWNTENYLVRTGASTTLRSNNSHKGLRLTIKPDGMKILSYHVPESKHRGKIRWMQLGSDKPAQIVRIISKQIAKRLK